MGKILQALIFLSTLNIGQIALQAQSSIYASAEDEKYWLSQEYITAFQHYAIEEMHKTGIPASITLAQGLHESNYGRSRLATLANNHFGAKAHNTWTGPVIHHDDDAPQEAFRKYESVEQSYRDHSKVLAKKRYAFLYHLNPYDYKAWSHGLKKAGYATDPNYAYKLINIIETYQLYIYDNPNHQQEIALNTVTVQKKLDPSEPGYLSATYTKPVEKVISRNTYRKAEKAKKKKEIIREVHSYQPINTKAIESVYANQTPEESVELAMRAVNEIERPDKEWYKGSKVVFFKNDMMPSEVAFWYDIDLDKLLKWNYAQAHIPFKAGKPIYFEPLRNKAGNFTDKIYTALRGQNLYDIALISGLKVERLMKLNKIKNPELFILPGEKVNLKRKNRKRPKTTTTLFKPFCKIENKEIVLLDKQKVAYKDNFIQRELIFLDKSYYKSIIKDEVKSIVGNSDYVYNNRVVSYPVRQQLKGALNNYISQAVFTSNITEPIERKAQSSKPIYHTVQKGQTLYRLSVIYDVDVDDIKSLNNLKDNTIKVGASVRVK